MERRIETQGVDPFDLLTHREAEILQLRADGLTRGEIGEKLGVSTDIINSSIQVIGVKDFGEPYNETTRTEQLISRLIVNGIKSGRIHHELPDNLYLDDLTDRESEISSSLIEKSNKEVGFTVHLPEKTVKKYITRIYKKFGVRNRYGFTARYTALEMKEAIEGPRPIEPIDILTPQHGELLRLIASGYKTRKMGIVLSYSEKTIKSKRSELGRIGLGRNSSADIDTKQTIIALIIDGVRNGYIEDEAPEDLSLAVLTGLECNVVSLLLTHSRSDIASALQYSESTIKNCIPRIYEKLGVRNRYQFAARYTALEMREQLQAKE